MMEEAIIGIRHLKCPRSQKKIVVTKREDPIRQHPDHGRRQGLRQVPDSRSHEDREGFSVPLQARVGAQHRSHPGGRQDRVIRVSGEDEGTEETG